MNDQIIWQRYIQEVESLSSENKVSKICKEVGFMRVVKLDNISTLPRDDPASQPREQIQGNLRIGPVLEVTTSFR